MKKLMLSSCALAFAFSANSASLAGQPSGEFRLSFEQATPYGNAPSNSEFGAELYVDQFSGVLGLDLIWDEASASSSSLAALHLRLPYEGLNGGVLLGSGGNNFESFFYGVEGGYDGKRIDLNLRATFWEIDGFRDSQKYDIDLAYKLSNKFSIFGQYSHLEFDGGNNPVDDYLVGLQYNINDQWNVELTAGEVHPIIEDQGFNQAWFQYGISFGYKFGAGETLRNRTQRMRALPTLRGY